VLLTMHDTSEPQALDPISGFKVPHRNLVRNWDGEMVDRRFADQRHPQDYVRGRKEQIALPNARPEPPDSFRLGNLLTESGDWIYCEDGTPIMAEGSVVRL
jgi:hypothetical protein